MPKLRNGKETKPVKSKPVSIKKVKERCLNDMICKAEKQALEKKQTKFNHKDIFGK